MKTTALIAAAGLLALAMLVSVNAEAPKDEKAEYVGPDVCKACHVDKVESYAHGTHGVALDKRTPAAKEGCESCHGPGSAHVKSGGGKGVAGIVGLSPQAQYPAEKKNALCLSCHHQGKIALWNGSMHQRKKLACPDCHNIHGGFPHNLAAANQTELCVRCHKDVNAQLRRPYHHPLRENKLQCSDCHNPHGSVTEKLIDAPSVNENCYKCHTEKRGPFLWQHPPVVENCLSCHFPHGGTHQKMLRERSPYLCQNCHSNARHPGTLYARGSAQSGQSTYQSVGNRGFFRGCTNCHSQVHGSNHPSGEYLER